MELYHVSTNPNLTTISPRIPKNTDDSACLENALPPRVCLSPIIDGCIRGITVYLEYNPDIDLTQPVTLYAYKVDSESIKTFIDQNLIDQHVEDANLTMEIATEEEVRPTCRIDLEVTYFYDAPYLEYKSKEGRMRFQCPQFIYRVKDVVEL